MDRARHDLLSGPGLAEDQDRRISPGDLRDPLHHFMQASLRSYDRVADILTGQAGEERGTVLFGRLPQPCQLVHPAVVLQRDSEGLARLLEDVAGVGRCGPEQQHADKVIARMERRGDARGGDPLWQQTPRESAVLTANPDLAGPPPGPGHDRVTMRSGQRGGRLRTGADAHMSDGVQATALCVPPPHEEPGVRDRGSQELGQRPDRFLDLPMARHLPPERAEERAHRGRHRASGA